MQEINIFWFRRDLRLFDNIGFNQALKQGKPVLPIFIFDTTILSQLSKDDARVSFIHQCLQKMDVELKKHNSSLSILKGEPIKVWKQILKNYKVDTIFTNKDYEPYALQRDREIYKIATQNNIGFQRFKDQVIFEENEVLKADGKPYTVYTPYKNKWLAAFKELELITESANLNNLFRCKLDFQHSIL